MREVPRRGGGSVGICRIFKELPQSANADSSLREGAYSLSHARRDSSLGEGANSLSHARRDSSLREGAKYVQIFIR